MAPFDDTVTRQSSVQQSAQLELSVCEADGDSITATVGDASPAIIQAIAPPGELVSHAASDIDLAIDQTGFFSGTEATEELARVAELTGKLEAYRVALVGRVQKTEVWREKDPNGTPVSFLRRELVLDHREASADLRLANGVGEFPELADALRSGHVTRAAVDLMLSIGLRNGQRQAAFPQFVGVFIDVARNATFSKLRQVLRAWADQIDPVATSSDEDEAFHRRYLHISELGDGVKLDGFFDTVNGMKIQAAINAAFTAEYKATHRAGDLIGSDGEPLVVDADLNCGDEPERPPITMSAKQRADAFITYLIEPVLVSGLLPTCGGALPHVLVTVPVDRLENPLASNGDVEQLQQFILDDQIDYHSAYVATSNGPGRQLLSATSAQLLSCDAIVQRVVMGPNSVPLDIGRSSRLIPTHIRRALIVRDQGCVFPFCDKPPGWTEAHHIQHWSQGGPTSLNNLVLLCSKHHHQVHNQNIGIITDPSGRPRITPTHWARE